VTQGTGKEDAMSTGAEILLEILKRSGIHTVFGIPSIHNLRLYEALREPTTLPHALTVSESSV
jgi:thiamine pyrophosphate-dependent acetolactate synthase large subunit-like protein